MATGNDTEREALERGLIRIKNLARIAGEAGITGDPARADAAIAKVEAVFLCMMFLLRSFADGPAKGRIVMSAGKALEQAWGALPVALKKETGRKTTWRRVQTKTPTPNNGSTGGIRTVGGG